MKLSEELYNSVKEIWQSYNEHPFVKGMEDGTLDIEKFKYYMIQDYLYLLDYSRIFALGVVKAHDENTMRLFAELVYSTLNCETSIHKAYMTRLNITKEEVENAKVSLANTSYTNYMLWVSQNGGILELAVAVLSCSWSYKIIADKINEKSDAKDHQFYGEWVQGYISEEYSEGNDKIINLVDKLGAGVTKEQLDNLKTIFINCSKYEYMFWDMAYNNGVTQIS
ncbi:thiaminase II [uncultured Clostridium sp.]|uniref:thiaminase II n=1 Tax=uncultured Clostridium sp. TaxID=59620 RepID=UPI0025EAEFA1|nr:thiaminase II [uncultured Clostridium sp.]